MKRSTAILMCLMALPLSAAEEKPAPKVEPKQMDAAATAPAESPLVQAARRAKKGPSKSIVITNATVKTAKGHLTTTTNDRTIVLPEFTPPAEARQMAERKLEKAAADKKAAAAAEKAKKDQEALARRAAAAEEGELGDDANVVVPAPAPANP